MPSGGIGNNLFGGPDLFVDPSSGGRAGELFPGYIPPSTRGGTNSAGPFSGAVLNFNGGNMNTPAVAQPVQNTWAAVNASTPFYNPTPLAGQNYMANNLMSQQIAAYKPPQQQPQQAQWINGVPYLNGSPLPANQWTSPGHNGQATTGSPSDFLASMGANNQYLQGFAQNGQPVNALPAWQSYVDAQQRNLQQNAANLMEMFNASGGYQSTSFGNAATDFWTQASKDQNSLLASMGYQSLNDAVNRQYGASQMLGQQAFGAGSQLAGYDFNSQMAQYNNSLQAALALGQGSTSAINSLAGYGSQAANQLLMNSLLGTNNLFGASNTAAQNMYNTSAGLLPSLLQYESAIRGQNITGATSLGNLYQNNLGLGGQLGQNQYGDLSQQLAAAYQEWLRTQSAYNPLIPYMFTGSTAFQPTTSTSTPGFWDYFSNILGSGIGAAGSILGGALSGGALSDERAKENITPIGKLGETTLYKYNYRGDPTPQIGVIAQEAVAYYPNSVMVGGAGKAWRVDYDKLMLEMLSGKVN